ncbi:MAG: DUF1638 domain-containing protein [Planctomycetota bacterium]|nr:DUF1638 domain-containing protein [Planctomycetota bacterium]
MRLKLLSCEIFYREMCWAVARSPHQVDIEFLQKGLHDMGSTDMAKGVQEVLDRVDGSKYSAVILGYALCNNGVVGLTARSIPLVVPRAHDCITLFLGSAARYLEYFNSHPGVYFKTTGWMERGTAERSQLSMQHKTGMDQSYEQLVAKYGEDNAKYLWDTLCDMTRNYKQFTFIEMGLEPNNSYEQQTRQDAAARGWQFEKVKGDMGMIQRLVNGQWDDKEFLVVRPGHRIVASFDDGIIAAEKIPAAARKRAGIRTRPAKP